MEANNVASNIAMSDKVLGGSNSELYNKYLTFWIDGQIYGFCIVNVVQIIGVQNITPVPEYPYYYKGIIDLRGTVVPVMDARLRLGRPEAQYDEHTCIIITNVEGTLVGLIVDNVREVTDISPEEISPPPQFMEDCHDNFLTGICCRDDVTQQLLNIGILKDDFI